MSLKIIGLGVALLILSLLAAITSQSVEIDIIEKKKMINEPVRRIIAEIFEIDIMKTYSKATLKIDNIHTNPLKVVVIGRDVEERIIQPKQGEEIMVTSLIDLVIIDTVEDNQSELRALITLELEEINRPYTYLAIVSLILFIGGNIVIATGIIFQLYNRSLT